MGPGLAGGPAYQTWRGFLENTAFVLLLASCLPVNQIGREMTRDIA